MFNPATQRTYYFPCNAWLEKDGESLAGCRKELVVGGTGEESHCRYKVEVKTSDVRGAGTDANVTVQVFGLKGDTGVQTL